MGHVSLVRQHQECNVEGERRRKKEGWGRGDPPMWDGTVLRSNSRIYMSAGCPCP